MKTSNILKIAIPSAIIVGGLFLVNKVQDYKKVIDQMIIDIYQIKKLRTSNARFYFDIDLSIKNPTNIDFSISTFGLIKIKKITLFYKNTEIGSANSEMTEFSLPKNGVTIIKNITIELLLVNLINEFFEKGLDTNPNNYSAVIEIEALNNTYTITQ